MTLIDRFKIFHERATKENFPISARVLYYTLLGEFNTARWPTGMFFTVRELADMTGLPTTTVYRAKNFLVEHGFIEVETLKNRTVYSLAEGGTDVEQKRNKSGTSFGTQKTFGAQGSIDVPKNTGGTDVEQKRNKSGTKIEIPNTRARVDIDIDKDIDEEEEERAKKIFERADIRVVWEFETGTTLTGSVAQELKELADRDYDGVKEAIKRSARAKAPDTVPYNYFRTVYDNMSKPQRRSKGGAKVASIDDYKPKLEPDPRGLDLSWITQPIE